MCKLKSAIILKDRVFIPDYDSHSKMLEELQIEDTRSNAERLLVRAELYPKDGDVFSPIDQWKFNVDQDIVPDWYVAGYDEERMRAAVKDWAKSHIHIGENDITINCGSNHYIKDCKNVTVCDSASISCVYGSASISKVCDSASISYVCDSANISEVYGSASIRYVYDSASISEVYDSASISYVCGSASISKVYGSASISYVYDSASINKVYGSASISYVCGSASISKVCGSASISDVCDSASISEVYGSASISEVCDSASISKVCGSAIISSPSFGWKNKEKVVISENATFKDNQTKTIWQSGDWKIEILNKENKE